MHSANRTLLACLLDMNSICGTTAGPCIAHARLRHGSEDISKLCFLAWNLIKLLSSQIWGQRVQKHPPVAVRCNRRKNCDIAAFQSPSSISLDSNNRKEWECGERKPLFMMENESLVLSGLWALRLLFLRCLPWDQILHHSPEYAGKSWQTKKDSTLSRH